MKIVMKLISRFWTEQSYEVKVGFKITLVVLIAIVLLDIATVFVSDSEPLVNESPDSAPARWTKNLLSLAANVLVEAHGLLFDLIVFAVIVEVLRVRNRKKQQIQQYEEEIDDFRGWREKEAGYRILGSIRRLNKLGRTQIDLSSTYLEGMTLNDLNLAGSDLSMANMSGASLCNVDLTGCRLSGTDLSGSNFTGAKLTGAHWSVSGIYKVDSVVTSAGKGRDLSSFKGSSKTIGSEPEVGGAVGWENAEMDKGLRALFVKRAGL